MRHEKQSEPSGPEMALIAGRILAEERRAAEMRSEFDRGIARIRAMKEQLAGLAKAGRTRKIFASPCIEGEGYIPLLIEVQPGGMVYVSRVERLADVIWPEAASVAGAADIEAAHAATAWDPPLGDNGDLPPLTDEEVLAALRRMERDDDD